jgi:hypothetical protein
MPYTNSKAARAAARKRWARIPKRACPRCGKHIHRCAPDLPAPQPEPKPRPEATLRKLRPPMQAVARIHPDGRSELQCGHFLRHAAPPRRRAPLPGMSAEPATAQGRRSLRPRPTARLEMAERCWMISEP